MKSPSTTIILIFLLFVFLGCEKETPVASFTINKTIAEVGEIVSFSNLSENSTDHIWDFGDGNATTNTNPTHIYEEVGIYTITLTVYDGTGTKDIATEIIEIVPPPLNIEPGIRTGNFYLNDDLGTHFAKLDTNKMEYRYILTSNEEHLHIFTFDYVGVKFYLYTPTENYTINDIPIRIEVYPPFEAWTMGGITFGSSFSDVAKVFGPHTTPTGDHFYNGIIFWADNSGLYVKGITIR